MKEKEMITNMAIEAAKAFDLSADEEFARELFKNQSFIQILLRTEEKYAEDECGDCQSQHLIDYREYRDYALKYNASTDVLDLEIVPNFAATAEKRLLEEGWSEDDLNFIPFPCQ